MKIVIAPDSFKESLSAREVAEAIECGLKKVWPDAECVKIPMADGGEGMVEALVAASGGRLLVAEVTAPMGNRVDAAFGLSGDGRTAMIEMAAASGLHLVPAGQRNPLLATSYGTGELIRAALDAGAEKVILGIGGSATNDGGAGMLQALGVKLLNQQNQLIGLGGACLKDLARVDISGLDKRLADAAVQVACDVDNPLCGGQGASAVFGPQKGATPAMVQELDLALAHFAAIVARDTGRVIDDHAGAGAAGGMGGGVLLLPDVKLMAGVDLVMEAVDLPGRIRDADWVITGEGRMDGQSVRGKTPIGVARAAKKQGKPVVALVGCLRADYEAVYAEGIDAVFPILREPGSLQEALDGGYENLVSAAQNVARLYQLAESCLSESGKQAFRQAFR